MLQYRIRSVWELNTTWMWNTCKSAAFKTGGYWVPLITGQSSYLQSRSAQGSHARTRWNNLQAKTTVSYSFQFNVLKDSGQNACRNLRDSLSYVSCSVSTSCVWDLPHGRQPNAELGCILSQRDGKMGGKKSWRECRTITEGEGFGCKPTSMGLLSL